MPAIDELSVAVVGARYENNGPGNRETEIRLTIPGEPVELRPEPKNKHDANAIAVFSVRGIQIGYVLGDRTPIIHRARHDAREVRAIFQEAVPEWGAWIRVAFDRQPTLPPAGPPALLGRRLRVVEMMAGSKAIAMTASTRSRRTIDATLPCRNARSSLRPLVAYA